MIDMKNNDAPSRPVLESTQPAAQCIGLHKTTS